MPTRKYSRQREAIKTFLAGRKDHPTADTIYSCLREEYPNISLGTVYRNLALLTDTGEIARINTGVGPERYDGTVAQHQHFICTRCERVYDVESEGMDELIRSAIKSCPGRIDSYTANFYGVCTDCQKSSGEKN
ncbi:MAG: transcriptional repressor [Lachnospiraceae bacterium]|nr:transcriptional repressor [Lachnospiraceae bacterium]